MTAYEASRELLLDRTRWTACVIATLANAAAREGWSTCSAEPRGTPDEHARGIAARLERTEARLAPLEWMKTRLGLDRSEHEALWLLACIELDPALSRAIGALLEGESLSIQLLQELLLRAGCDPLRPEQLGRLAQHGLIETAIDPRMPLNRRWVRVPDRVLELAQGHLRLDAELASICELVSPDAALPDVAVPAAITAALAAQRNPIVVAIGPEGVGRTMVLRAAMATRGKGVLFVDASELSGDPIKLARQLRVIARECALFGVVPIVRGADCWTEDAERRSVVGRELFEALACPILVTASDPMTWRTPRALVTVSIDLPTESAREQIWRGALAGVSDDVIVEAGRYRVTPGTISKVAETAMAAAGAGHAVGGTHIRDGLRAHFDRRLGSLAKRIETKQTWEDLVLPAGELDQIIELVSRVRHRKQVLETWGFEHKVGRGVGVAALFSGPPGTGKTMVAGLVAKELGLDLYQVDLSSVTSKFIGETEKNLATLFDAAESGHAVLLFDEADSLFAKRSDVKSSNDRYANLEVNYLLQRLEAFRGIAILTTNHETSIDAAFRRRLAIHVRFPMPEETERLMLWRAVLPAAAAVEDDLDFERLASEFEMTGAYIRNAVLRAAYHAAGDERAIGMVDVWRAAQLEYEAMGKLAMAR